MKRVLFLLGHLSNEDIEWMVRNGDKKTISGNTKLVKKGNKVEHLYIVLTGEFAITSDENVQSKIASLKSGEVIGEMSLIEKRLPSVNVFAVEDSEVFYIPINLIEERMKNNLDFKSSFYFAIALFLSNRLRKTTEQMGYGKPEETDELDLNVLDNVADAGNKFMEVLNKFAEV